MQRGVLLVFGMMAAATAAADPLGGKSEDEKPWAFGLEARMPILKGQPAEFNPDVGVGIGVHFQRLFRAWFALRVAVDYDRVFQTRSVGVPGAGFEVRRSQNLTSASFLVEPTFRWTRRWFTAHFAVGAGLWVGFYENAEVEVSRKIDVTSVLTGLRLEAGVTFRLHRSFALGLAFNYDFRRGSDTVPDPQGSQARYKVFDDQMAVGLRLDYLF